jgi:hypothetical protein
MAKKKVTTRKIPSMVVTINGGDRANIESLCSNVVFASAVYKETVASIKDAINIKAKTAILFELEKSEYYIDINKSDWKNALQACIDKLIETEDYELCSMIKDLMDKIK